VDVCADREPAETAEPYGPAQLSGQPGRFPLKNVLDVLSSIGGHGEVLAAGVLSPGDRGIGRAGKHGEPGDLGLEARCR
jgi:hypothetical protein